MSAQLLLEMYVEHHKLQCIPFCTVLEIRKNKFNETLKFASSGSCLIFRNLLCDIILCRYYMKCVVNIAQMRIIVFYVV